MQTADLAIDLGTSTIRVADRHATLVWSEPSIIAMSGQGNVVAIGSKAHQMVGRTPTGVSIVSPIEAGIAANRAAATRLLEAILASHRSLRGPSLVVAIPHDASPGTRALISDCCTQAGARRVTFTSTTICSALGSGLPLMEPVGSMIVDAGGGRTDVGVLSMGGMVAYASAPIGGQTLNRALISWLRSEHGLLIGTHSAGVLQRRVGGAVVERHQTMRVRGRDTATGQPRELDVTTKDTVSAYRPIIDNIREVVLNALRQTSPEVAGDILDRGAILCGGVSHLPGFDVVLRDATGLPMLVAESPMRCCIDGGVQILNDNALMKRVTHER